ncbi:MAG TPA: hypothetical protein VI894_00180 [Candidatus Nanoarchaeia archaeon]|nr:hypothetical protein [Candidatus Nanoarchaeia archaeon]
MTSFTDVFTYLADIGVLDSLLPFLLVFTIVFAILQKGNIFGTEKKNINVVIALIMGLAVVIPHVTGTYPPNADVVNIMNSALPNVSIVIIAVIMVLLMIGIFAPDVSWFGSSIQGWMVLIAIAAVFFIFGNAAGWWQTPTTLSFLNNPDTQALIVIILVFGIIVWWVTSEPEKQTKMGWFQKFGEGLSGMFPGKK